MRKSILTLILFASIQMFAFAQSNQTAMTVEENLQHVEKRVDEKSDITGTFAKVGTWNVYIDDALVDINAEPVKVIKKADMQDLLQAGFKFVQKDKSAYPCYRYRIVAKGVEEQKMLLYECQH